MADDTESKASKPDDIPPYPAGCATVFAWMIIALPVIFLFWACGAFEDDSFDQYNDPSTPRPLATPSCTARRCGWTRSRMSRLRPSIPLPSTTSGVSNLRRPHPPTRSRGVEGMLG